MCERNGYRVKPNSRIDRCIRKVLPMTIEPLETLGSCCGHGKYPMTVVVRNKITGRIYELFTGVTVPRMRRFYVRDEEGIYFIPEALEAVLDEPLSRGKLKNLPHLQSIQLQNLLCNSSPVLATIQS